MERRYLSEAIQPGEGNVAAGYAIVFGAQSQELRVRGQVVREVIEARALEGADMSDVTLLYNHNQDNVLGRTTSGTLNLQVDSRGLAFSAQLPDTSAGRDVRQLLERGDLRASSFQFTVPAGGERMERAADGTLIRRIQKIGRLIDVSIVTRPAYPDASAHVRSLEEQVDALGAADAEKEAAQAAQQLQEARRRLKVDTKA